MPEWDSLCEWKKLVDNSKIVRIYLHLKFFNYYIFIMSVVAPAQDLLVRVKNAYMARRNTVTGIVHSNFLESIVSLLKKYKFVKNYTIDEDGKKRFLNIQLHDVVDPVQDIPVIRLYSKPSRRRYVSYKDIKPVAWWTGIGIISTSKGLLPTHVAKQLKVWGELIAEIY